MSHLLLPLISAAVVGLCAWIALKLVLPPRVLVPKKPSITIKHADRISDPGRRDFVIQMVQRAVQDPTLSLFTSATMLSKPLQYDPDLKRTYIVAILQTEDDERDNTCSELEIHYSNRPVGNGNVWAIMTGWGVNPKGDFEENLVTEANEDPVFEAREIRGKNVEGD
ncbi:uncharacterized protein J3D65DRAFT_683975 [Phyllosticta citribraziliensis]|uniref:Uncharacterized protein n=1 Tax=Phyllosticta citribraziliensis TaxID=989973 RepID=A0ABR1ME93_9PEZI